MKLFFFITLCWTNTWLTNIIHFQPPWDLEVGKRFIIHYTYGCDYNMKVNWSLPQIPFSTTQYLIGISSTTNIVLVVGHLILLMIKQGELTYGKIGEWRFDKRSYLRGPPPKNLTLPPPGVPESVVCLNLLFTALKYVGELLTEKSAWESIKLHFCGLKNWDNRFICYVKTEAICSSDIVPLHLFCILLSDWLPFLMWSKATSLCYGFPCFLALFIAYGHCYISFFYQWSLWL